MFPGISWQISALDNSLQGVKVVRFWNRSQTMGLAAVIVAGSVLLSRFMGLIRDKVISYWFGASIDSDLYFTAFVLPDFINYLLAGAYFSIPLIPILARLFKDDEQDGWSFFSASLLWVLLAIATLTIAGEVFAVQIVPYLAPGFSTQDQSRLITFVRIILPAQVFFLTGACFSAILYLRKQFVVPSLSPIIYNGGIILTGLVFKNRGIEGFCWGVLVGSFFGNFLLPLLAVKYGGGMSLKFRLWHREMRSFILTALPLMLGQSIVVLDEQLVRIFGSLAGMGVVSHINYARRLMMVPDGIVGQAAAVASYPFMAELFARGKIDEFFATIRMALKNTFFFVFLCSFGMASVAEPIVGLIFQQGRFGPSDTVATARLLQLYLVSVPIWCFQQILGRAFYAVGDTLSPVVIGTLTTLLVLPLFFLGAIHLGGEGVVMASVLGFLFYSVILSLWWVKRYKGYKIFEGITEKLLRYAIAGLVSLIFAKGFYFVMSSYISLSDHSFISYLFSGLVSGSFFCIVWLLSAMLLFKGEMLEFAKGCFRKN